MRLNAYPYIRHTDGLRFWASHVPLPRNPQRATICVWTDEKSAGDPDAATIVPESAWKQDRERGLIERADANTISRARAHGLHILMGAAGIPYKQHYAIASTEVGREITSLTQLTPAEARDLETLIRTPEALAHA